MASLESQLKSKLKSYIPQSIGAKSEAEIRQVMEEANALLSSIIEKYVQIEAGLHNGWTFDHLSVPITLSPESGGTVTAIGGSNLSGGGRPSFTPNGTGEMLRYYFEYGWNAKHHVWGVWHGNWTRSRASYSGDHYVSDIVMEFNAQAPDGIIASTSW